MGTDATGVSRLALEAEAKESFLGFFFLGGACLALKYASILFCQSLCDSGGVVTFEDC